MLSKRAKSDAAVVLNASLLRTRAIGLLNQFREALNHEIDQDQNLPRDLIAQVFSYYDKLQEIRESNQKNPAAAEQESEIERQEIATQL